MSGLTSKQATFDVEIPFPPADQVVAVGTPKDSEGDKVTVLFNNNGFEELSFDLVSGSVLVAASAKEGTYGASLKVEDDNSQGALATTYILTFNVALASNSTANETETKSEASSGAQTPPVVIN